MAPRGLKKGDRFVDGGLTYEVVEVRGDRYISKRVNPQEITEVSTEAVEEAPVEEAPEETPKEEPKKNSRKK